MSDIFKLTTRPPEALFFRRDDKNDVRLGEIVSFKREDYESAEIVIIGCPQDEGVERNKGRTGAAKAPDEIRRAFYKLTDFGIEAKIFDLGNTEIKPTLEETHEAQIEIVKQLIQDGKKVISLGGGNDVSYPDCRALSETVGAQNLLAFNVDAHFDVRADEPRNSGTPYRQLLEEKLLNAENFFEMAYQPQAISPVYFEYLRRRGVIGRSLYDLRERDFVKTFIEILSVSGTAAIFWGFDVDAVRASDAPGVSAPSPIGLTAEEFCALASIAGSETRTNIIEFTEVNPEFDIDGRTAKLAAIAMHRFCAAVSRIGTQIV